MCGHSFRATHSLSSTHNAAGSGEKMFTRMLFWFPNCFVCLPPAWGGKTQSWSYKWGNDSDVNRREQRSLPPPISHRPQTGWGLLIGCQEWKTGRTSDDWSHPLPDCIGGCYSSVFIHVVDNVGREINHFNLWGHVNTGNLIQRDKKCVENKEFRVNRVRNNKPNR